MAQRDPIITVIDEVAWGTGVLMVAGMMAVFALVVGGTAFLCYAAFVNHRNRQKQLPAEDPWTVSYGADLTAGWDGNLYLPEAIVWD